MSPFKHTIRRLQKQLAAAPAEHAPIIRRAIEANENCHVIRYRPDELEKLEPMRKRDTDKAEALLT